MVQFLATVTRANKGLPLFETSTFQSELNDPGSFDPLYWCSCSAIGRFEFGREARQFRLDKRSVDYDWLISDR